MADDTLRQGITPEGRRSFTITGGQDRGGMSDLRETGPTGKEFVQSSIDELQGDLQQKIDKKNRIIEEAGRRGVPMSKVLQFLESQGLSNLKESKELTELKKTKIDILREQITPEEQARRETFRGVPQEEGAELTPEQQQVRGGIAGGVTPAEISKSLEGPTKAQAVGEVVARARTVGKEALTPVEMDIYNKEFLNQSGLNMSVSPDGTVSIASGGKPLPASQSEKMINLLQFSSQVDMMETLYDPSFVGVIDSMIGGIKEKTGLDVDTQEVAFRRIANDLGDALLRMRSGAAITDSEYKRLLKIVPHVGLSDDAFVARLADFKRQITEDLQIRQKAATDIGQRSPSIPVQSAPTATTGQQVSPDMARQFLEQAGGDKEEARRLAREGGFTF